MYLICTLVYDCTAFAAVCWERIDGTSATYGQFNGGVGSTDPPNYYYFSHADGDREACQLACEQEPGCHAYTIHQPDYANGWANMCFGMSESLAVRRADDKAHSGYKVDCGSQTSKIYEQSGC